VYSSATPANSQAMLEAKRNKKPFGKLITSTPGDLNSDSGKFCKEFINNAAIFDEKMYDWTDEEIEEYIQKNSLNNFVYVKFSYKQLGRSEQWFLQQCRDLNMDRLAINREILLQWCFSNDISPFTEDELERLVKHIKDPIGKLFVKKYYPFEIYKDFDWHDTVLVGIDVSGAYQKDYSTITIADKDTLEVLAHFKNNVVDSVELSEIIFEMVTKFFPNSVLIPERNSYGRLCPSY
jgi:hypothetical protein